MDEDDDEFLKKLNKVRDASTQCSEDQFEEVMNFFEETTSTKQPYAAVDSSPVLTYDEMEIAFDENIDVSSRAFAKEIYEHWKDRRKAIGNKSLITSLKVGLRVRQIRKTRGRDAHSAEKLKKLRKELEESRQIVALVKQREMTKRELLAVERQLFEQRTSLRGVKKNLPEKYQNGDEDLLINQKVGLRPHHDVDERVLIGVQQPKKRQSDMISQRTPGTQLRLPPRPDGRAPDSELVSLSELLAAAEKSIEDEIEMKIAQFRKWNENHIDWTTVPLTPPLEESTRTNFRTATTEYLPTPPASISSEPSGENVGNVENVGSPSHAGQDVTVRYASPSGDGQQPSFRRRYGRGGRLFIDRRGVRLDSKVSKDCLDERIADRWKYDNDDDDDDNQVATYLVDRYDIKNMIYRTKVLGSQQNPQMHRRAAVEGVGSNSQNSSRPSTSASIHRQASSG